MNKFAWAINLHYQGQHDQESHGNRDGGDTRGLVVSRELPDIAKNEPAKIKNALQHGIDLDEIVVMKVEDTKPETPYLITPNGLAVQGKKINTFHPFVAEKMGYVSQHPLAEAFKAGFIRYRVENGVAAFEGKFKPEQTDVIDKLWLKHGYKTVYLESPDKSLHTNITKEQWEDAGFRVENFWRRTLAKGESEGEERLIYSEPITLHAEHDQSTHGNWATGSHAVDTPEFKAWFGKSKVVDSHGNPMRVYHGTSEDFSKFDPNASESFGIHFGTAEVASNVAQGFGATGHRVYVQNENVMPVYLKMEKPIRFEEDLGFTDPQEIADVLRRKRIFTPADVKSMAGDFALIEEKGGTARWDDDSGYIAARKSALRKIENKLIAKGYDGFIYPNQFEGRGTISYAVFKPEQIKSATGNRGKFDPKNPDITAAEISLGGEGSGHWGHAGRIGEVGGSAPSGEGGSRTSQMGQQGRLWKGITPEKDWRGPDGEVRRPVAEMPPLQTEPKGIRTIEKEIQEMRSTRRGGPTESSLPLMHWNTGQIDARTPTSSTPEPSEEEPDFEEREDFEDDQEVPEAAFEAYEAEGGETRSLPEIKSAAKDAGYEIISIDEMLQRNPTRAISKHGGYFESPSWWLLEDGSVIDPQNHIHAEVVVNMGMEGFAQAHRSGMVRVYLGRGGENGFIGTMTPKQTELISQIWMKKPTWSSVTIQMTNEEGTERGHRRINKEEWEDNDYDIGKIIGRERRQQEREQEQEKESVPPQEQPPADINQFLRSAERFAWKLIVLHAEHDQRSHGSWAHGSGHQESFGFENQPTATQQAREKSAAWALDSQRQQAQEEAKRKYEEEKAARDRELARTPEERRSNRQEYIEQARSNPELQVIGVDQMAKHGVYLISPEGDAVGFADGGGIHPNIAGEMGYYDLEDVYRDGWMRYRVEEGEYGETAAVFEGDFDPEETGIIDKIWMKYDYKKIFIERRHPMEIYAEISKQDWFDNDMRVEKIFRRAVNAKKGIGARGYIYAERFAWTPIILHAEHDQSTHGNWADGSAAAEVHSRMISKAKELGFDVIKVEDLKDSGSYLILPDGTAIIGARQYQTTHGDMLSEMGMDFPEVFRAGVMRVGMGTGAYVEGSIKSKQIKIIEKLFLMNKLTGVYIDAKSDESMETGKPMPSDFTAMISWQEFEANDFDLEKAINRVRTEQKLDTPFKVAAAETSEAFWLHYWDQHDQSTHGNRGVAAYVRHPAIDLPAGKWLMRSGARWKERPAEVEHITQPDHLYRGMTEDEFNATVAHGTGIHSRGDYSAAHQGTSFSADAETAESYVNFGRDDPRTTGRPTYLVEIEGHSGTKLHRDGYYTTRKGERMPAERITRIIKMEAVGDEIIGTEIDPKQFQPLGTIKKDVLSIETKPFMRKLLPEALDILHKIEPAIEPTIDVVSRAFLGEPIALHAEHDQKSHGNRDGTGSDYVSNVLSKAKEKGFVVASLSGKDREADGFITEDGQIIKLDPERDIHELLAMDLNTTVEEMIGKGFMRARYSFENDAVVGNFDAEHFSEKQIAIISEQFEKQNLGAVYLGSNDFQVKVSREDYEQADFDLEKAFQIARRKPSQFSERIKLHADHDQLDHGNWAHNAGGQFGSGKAAGSNDFKTHADEFANAFTHFRVSEKVEGFTYDTQTGKAITARDASTPEGKRNNIMIYNMFGGDGKKPVYIVAVTNNIGGIGGVARDWQRYEGERRTLGNWGDPESKLEFNDLGVAFNNKSRGEIVKMLREGYKGGTKQQSAILFNPDGTFDFVLADEQQEQAA